MTNQEKQNGGKGEDILVSHPVQPVYLSLSTHTHVSIAIILHSNWQSASMCSVTEPTHIFTRGAPDVYTMRVLL